MKEKYETPTLQVINVNAKHIIAVSQIGEGTQDEQPEVKSAGLNNHRDIWNEKW